MKPVGELKMIALSKLVAHKGNVRKDPASDEAQAELVASIRAHGLLHNLVVVPRKGGKCAVIAGERRRQALNTIWKEDGGIEPDVPCLVTKAGNVKEQTERSLSENVTRSHMHPADQVEAFAVLAGKGATAEDIGNRFGYEPRYVRSLLRLGGLPAEVLEDWRAGEIDGDAARALATTADMELAASVYKRVKKGGRLDAWQIRNTLNKGRVSAGSEIARYVGLEAYQKDGGTIEETLFDDRDEVKITDPNKLTKLALAKLERAAKKVEAEGWKWVRSELDLDWQVRDEHLSIEPIPKYTKAEQASITALDDEMEAILERQRSGEIDYNERWSLEREVNKKRIPIREKARKRAKYSDEQKALAGAFVTIEGGRGKVIRGMVAPKDKAAYKRLMAGDEKKAGKAKGNAAVGPYPNAVMADVRHMRGAAIRRALADEPRIARDVLTWQLARESRFMATVFEDDLLALSTDGGGTRIPPASKALKADLCGAAVLQPFTGSADFDWIDEPDDTPREVGKHGEAQLRAFGRFMALSEEQRDVLLAHLVADLLIPRLKDEHPAHEALVELLNVDMPQRAVEAQVAPVPSATFWNRLPKATILTTAGQVLSKAWAEGRAKMKKWELVEAAYKAFAEGSTWLPKGF